MTKCDNLSDMAYYDTCDSRQPNYNHVKFAPARRPSAALSPVGTPYGLDDRSKDYL